MTETQKLAFDASRSKFISFGWLTGLISQISRKGSMQVTDVHELSNQLKSQSSGQQIAQNYNKYLQLSKYGKKMPSVISLTLKTYKQRSLWLLLTIPISSLAGICTPITVRQFSQFLTPSTYFDCEQMFQPDYQFESMSYKNGLLKTFNILWGYLVLVLCASLVKLFCENFAYAQMLRISVSTMTGLLDILYNKILLLSDATRQTSASGNLVNLLYTDSQKISVLLYQFGMLCQMPVDLVANIIYVIVQVNPLALTGLLAYFILFPIIGIVVSNIAQNQKKLMNVRDLRLARANEILAGIKVVKLFALEDTQEARMRNLRNREVRVLIGINLNFSGFGLVSNASSPLLTTIAYIALFYSNQFDTATAITAMSLFQNLSTTITMLPMLMSNLAQAKVSSNRIFAFLTLKERDQGVLISFDKQQDQDSNAVQFIGKPSFSWALQSDLEIPPILDPFYKETSKLIQRFTKKLPALNQNYQSLLSQLGNSGEMLSKTEITILQKGPKAILSSEETLITESWCQEFDIVPNRLLENVEQFKELRYNYLQVSPIQEKIKKLFLLLQVAQYFMNKYDKSTNMGDLPIVIHQLDLKIQKGQLIGVCGQVGSGKTSLFHSILGELRLCRKMRQDNSEQDSGLNYYSTDQSKINSDPNDGQPHIIINGRTAYFSQSPIIFSRTIRDNITFGRQFQKEKYDHIVDICCLLPDFAMFEGGDLIEVGGKGVTLSGGQKARIALARAIYSDADIMLLDDPLSAVDSHVGFRLWEEVIKGYLCEQGKTIIIASHQTQYFQDCDKIIQMVNGYVNFFGTLQELKTQQIEIRGLTEEVSQALVSKTDVLQVKPVSVTQLDDTVRNNSDISKGKLIQDEQVSANSLKTLKQWFSVGPVGILLLFATIFIINQAITQYQGIFITHWTGNKYKWTTSQAQISITGCDSQSCQQVNIDFMMKFGQIIARDTTKSRAYGTCLNEKFGATTTVSQQTSSFYLLLYGMMTLAIVIFSYGGNVAFSYYCLSISKKLHNNMISKLLKTRMLFFDTTPQGRILNRLSKDTDTSDTVITMYMQQVVSMSLMILGVLISVACINWPSIIIIIILIIVFLLIFLKFRKVYPHVKRIDAITKSPVFNSCQETVDSLICIRSFRREQDFLINFRSNVNINGSVYMYSYGMQRWLAFRLGMLTSFFSMIVPLIAVIVSPFDQTIASYAGQIVQYGSMIGAVLLTFVTGMVSLEGEMVSVERLIEYADLKTEGSYEDEKFHPTNWPQKNSTIEIKNLKFRYNTKQDFILKDINFSLEASEHVGIVGRTGAGKSTITQALFRIAEPELSTQIIIDKIDITKIGLHQARRVLSIIPQEPFLFSGTLRQNLCPVSQAKAENIEPPIGFKQFSDEQLWDALEQVQMKSFFRGQPSGLETKISANGDNLSAGQKQLVCIARALLRNATCIILDEATAQVDRENDQLIQETLRTALKNTTVLSIAHRIDTIIDFDRVIVMDQGEIVEFDTPAALLKNPDGIFTGLVEKTGPESAQKLRAAAIAAEQSKVQSIDQ